MAVPGRTNEDDFEEDNALFEEEGFLDDEEDFDHSNTPPHLTALVSASQLGDVVALRHALDDLEGSIDQPVEDGDTALHLTCLYGHLSCVQLLLERGANMEAKDEDGAIPLHDACAGGFIEIVQLLINSASDAECVRRMLDTVDVDGDTPLHHAARGEHADVVRLLLDSGASPTKRNLSGKTPGELPDPDTDTRRIFEASTSTNTVACQ